MNICQENTSLVTVRQFLSNLLEDLIGFRYFRRHGFAIKALLAMTSSSTVHREGIVASPLKEWLRERATVLRYTYIADLFQG